MTATPWGDSETLAEGRLQPIRGASREQVSQSQRQRLFAATVAVVSERGFAAATLGEILSTSGISSRSFYALFPDKAACVAATVKAILARCSSSLQPPEDGKGLAERLRAYYLSLAEAVIAQPAAARLCLIDSYAAGPEARRPLESARAQVLANLRRLYRGDPALAELPEEILAARVGAVLEIVVGALLRDPLELVDLAEDLTAMIMADRAPPRTLRSSPRPTEPADEALAAVDPAERAIRAFAIVVGEQGYAETKAADVIQRAGMSSRTFYANFSGKEDLMAAAVESACAQAVAAAVPAFSRGGEWPDAVRSAFSALFGFLASRPDLTRLVLLDSFAAGEQALRLLNRGLEPLGRLLVNNTTEWWMTPKITFEMIAATVRSLVIDVVALQGAAALPELTPICTYLALGPFLGAEVAAEAAGAPRGSRPADSAPIRRRSDARALGLHKPLKASLWLAHLVVVRGEGATVDQIGEALGEDRESVAKVLAELVAGGGIETLEVEGELRYRRSEIRTETPHRLSMISDEQRGDMDPDEWERVVLGAWETIAADMQGSMAEGTFRDPRYWVARTPILVDSRGRRELIELHDQLFLATLDLHERSDERLRESGEDPIQMSSIQLAFERLTRDLP